MQKEKQQLRDAVRKRLAALSDKDRAAESRSLCRRLVELLPGDASSAGGAACHAERSTKCADEAQAAPPAVYPEPGRRAQHDTTICAFVPLQDEPDIRPLLEALLTGENRLFFPRFEGGVLVFRNLQDLSGLQPGPLNTLEPPAGAPLLDPATLSHALVPGCAFDRSGNRLGRGNGGYDRWIALQREANSQTVFLGVCFECQLVQEVPVEAHDQPVDAVVTARGIVRNSQSPITNHQSPKRT